MAFPPTPAATAENNGEEKFSSFSARASLLAGHAAVLAAELGADLLRGAEQGMLTASAAGVSLATDADLCPDAAGHVAAAAAASPPAGFACTEKKLAMLRCLPPPAEEGVLAFFMTSRSWSAPSR